MESSKIIKIIDRDIPKPEDLTRVMPIICSDSLYLINTLKNLGWKDRGGNRSLDFLRKAIFTKLILTKNYDPNGNVGYCDQLNCDSCIQYIKPNSIWECHSSVSPTFELVISNNKNVSEPRNNDGRDFCYWCNIKTQKRGDGAYDICPKCGK